MIYIIELPDGQQFRMRDEEQAYYAASLAWTLLYALVHVKLHGGVEGPTSPCNRGL
ncbi:MAG: hypothetical protein ACO1Q7_02080 [Gemmatimonas sp.]